MTSQQPPPGWYDDPNDPASFQYWDGSQWTGHQSPKPATPMATFDRAGSDKLERWQVVLILFAVGAGVTAIVLGLDTFP